MGCDVAEFGELPNCSTIKVHSLMCVELKKFLQRISHIFSDIESARPRCASGIQMLCSLHVTLDKANLLIQHCCESSKFYLVVTAERIQLRFERIRNMLESCLSQIENVVPPSLAAKISGINHDLRNAKFPLEPSEDEAGKVVLALFRRDITASGSENQLELKALQLAALRLNITSALALLKEKRSIKRQLGKAGDIDTDATKIKVLKYLLYLLRKYGESVWRHEQPCCQFNETEAPVISAPNKAQVDDSSTLEPPEEFKCPLSMKLMFDPVVIASGKTFERLWIEKWFNEGHMTCPQTHMRLDNLSLVPNVSMKGLISKWCLKTGVIVSKPDRQPKPPPLSSRKTSSSISIASFGSSVDDLYLQTSHVSLRSTDTDRSLDSPNNEINDKFSPKLPQMKPDSLRYQSLRKRHASSLASLSKLALRPWGSQCDAVENVKKQLNDNQQCYFPNSYMKPLIKFLKDAHDLGDVKAQQDGAEVLLAILSCSRVDMPALEEDEVFVLVSFLDSEITEKALAIIEVLSSHEGCKSELMASGVLPSILKLLDTETREFHELSIKILGNLSHNSDIVYHIVFLDCIPKLVSLLEVPILARYCIKIIKVLCTSEETITTVADTSVCITHIVKLLEIGTKDEQEDIVDILFSLCNSSAKYCQLTMTESIVQSLVDISVNGNSRAQVTAKELLLLLEHNREGNGSDCSNSDAALSQENLCESATHHKDHKSSTKSFGFLGKKVSRFLHAKH